MTVAVAAAASGRLPPPPARVFLVGLGGIGMSGLAQALQDRGYAVAGSDRLLDGPGRSELVAQLRGLGLAVYPQDGSGPRQERPDVLVTSAAVEAGNPDLEAAPGVPVCPRARALAALLNAGGGCQIAVAGSAGKTSVTGWIAAALRALGRRVMVVNGGYMLDAESAQRPGNYAADADPEFQVVEVDESDRSLVEFTPDVGVLLNIGTDHYGREELLAVFGRFLDQCREACVLPAGLAAELAGHGPARRRLFAPAPAAEATAVVAPSEYEPGPHGAAFVLPGAGRVASTQYGRHSATNAAAVLAALEAAGGAAAPAAMVAALGAFRGIRQRFEYVGQRHGRPVYHDYAHNVQKIAAALDTAREAAGSPVTAFFQPHGYGPLGFMREALAETLREALRPGDRWVFLPVYYAGGSSSFTPTAAAVAAEYAAAGLPASALERRDDAAALLDEAGADAARAILVLGARDPSLPAFAAGLCHHP
ncbi:MAG: UDP-N-acetylmuramate--alanine ligase [Lentisphaerae bacterium]|nr:UDP-N-acetylmuramate--alanine ligase [Lentisphaerota bacterium]